MELPANSQSKGPGIVSAQSWFAGKIVNMRLSFFESGRNEKVCAGNWIERTDWQPVF